MLRLKDPSLRAKDIKIEVLFLQSKNSRTKGHPSLYTKRQVRILSNGMDYKGPFFNTSWHFKSFKTKIKISTNYDT